MSGRSFVRIQLWLSALLIIISPEVVTGQCATVVQTTADNFVAENFPTESFSDDTHLWMRGCTTCYDKKETFVEFQIPDIDMSPIDSVMVRFTASGEGGPGGTVVEVSMVPVPVIVDSLTWNTRPPYGSVLATKSVHNGAVEIPLPVDSLQANQTLVLRFQLLSDNWIYFRSRESGGMIPELGLYADLCGCEQPKGMWTGCVSTDWKDPLNWGLLFLPDDTTAVVIPTSPIGGRWPHVMDPGMECGDLTVESGAFLYVDPSGHGFTTHGDVINDGTIAMAGGYQDVVMDCTGGPYELSGTGVWVDGTLKIIGPCFLASDVVLSTVYTNEIGGGLVGNLSAGNHTLTVEGDIINSGTISSSGIINIYGSWRCVSPSYVGEHFIYGTVNFVGDGGSSVGYPMLGYYFQLSSVNVNKSGGAALYSGDLSIFQVGTLTVIEGSFRPEGICEAGAITIEDGGSMFLSGSAVEVTAYDIAIEAGGSLTNSGGRLYMENDIDVYGDFNLSSNGLVEPYQFAANGGDIRFHSGSGGVMSGGELVVSELAHWYPGSSWTATGGLIRARPVVSTPVSFNMQSSSVQLPNVIVDPAVEAEMHDSTTQVLDIGGAMTLEPGAVWRLDGKSMAVGAGLMVNDATFMGPGTVAGAITNDGAVEIDPPPGLLNVTGDYTQIASADLTVEITGTDPSQYDRLDITGLATLDGSLTANLGGGYTPTIGDSFVVARFGARSGQFAAFAVSDSLPPGATWGMGYSDTTAVLFARDLGWSPAMVSVGDVPGDQGGWVRVRFARSAADDPGETQYPIATYDLHRRIDDGGLAQAVLLDGEPLPGGEILSREERESIVSSIGVLPSSARRCRYDGRVFAVTAGEGPLAPPPGTWEVVASVSARQQPEYIVVAPSVGDSSTTIPYSVFFVSAHSTTPSVYFDSAPDSGYSVDNIAPGVPSGFAVAYNTGLGNQLSWDLSGDDDFQYFRVYRSTDPNFTPTLQDLVHSTVQTSWADPEYDGGGIHYKITALDYVGNESPPASPETVSGLGEHNRIARYALHRNVPNPFNPTTVIRYDVPEGGGKVALRIHNVAGRLVRTLVNSVESAGEKQVAWDGRDEHGRLVSSGVYFYRMTAPGFTKTRKMVLLK